MRNQGGGDEDWRRIWMRMKEITEAHSRRTATSYRTIDLLAEGQWPPIEEKVCTRVEAQIGHDGSSPG
jgi:hypothetical protein